jgi:hypothetical protein
MARQANTIVAQTFGWDAAEMREYRYQDTRTGKLAIYTIGNNYFTVSKTKPTWDDLGWQEYPDQFWAKQSNTVIWFAEVKEE